MKKKVFVSFDYEKDRRYYYLLKRGMRTPISSLPWLIRRRMRFRAIRLR